MTLTALADVLAAGCLIIGATLSLAAGVGVLRFPDVLSRMHAATKPQVLGLLLILSGVALRLRSQPDLATVALVALFQLATAPVAAHLVGRASYRSRRFRPELLVTDELATRAEDLAAESSGSTLAAESGSSAPRPRSGGAGTGAVGGRHEPPAGAAPRR